MKKIKFPLSLRGAKRRSNLKGFSLIELMVAVVILAMAIFGIFLAFSTGFQGMADARDRTVATNYAQEKMEELINKPFEDITDEPLDYIPGQTKFERKVDVTDEVVGEIKKVTTTVSWTNRKEEIKTVTLETLIYNNDS
ncbi:MAG: prepilin-type N-terminal cleavage/methylation domain-containing protein [Candidatus Atribacteria bacterium]|nr:prepilin-type N-terminal cleavage/methylation domain-containing protein [Candidatus Atribacteria bacterium]